MTVTLAHPYQAAHPEWWDAKRDGATDDLAKINAMFASGPEEFIFSDGDYEVTAPPTFPATGLIKAFGTVTEGVTTHVYPGLRFLDTASIMRAGTLQSDASILAANNVVAGGDAGESGYLEGRAGTGTKKFRSGGLLGHDLANKTTASGAATQLGAIDVPANTLVTDGDTLDLRAGGSATDFDVLNVIAIRMGTTVIATVNLGNDTSFNGAGEWSLHCRIIKTAANVVRAVLEVVTSAAYQAGVAGTGNLANADFVSGTVAVTLTSDQTLNIYATPAVGNTITAGLFQAEFLPAPV
jgi:hypothetical protein